ncbi:hypothetical protein E2542_SST24409 [Spatholobus suberectus]|nr:hypothetical protein E2542_SST24409 [Spatholobus suberectus]
MFNCNARPKTRKVHNPQTLSPKGQRGLLGACLVQNQEGPQPSNLKLKRATRFAWSMPSRKPGGPKPSNLISKMVKRFGDSESCDPLQATEIEVVGSTKPKKESPKTFLIKGL